ncbi:Malic enzyme, NAD binding domain [Luteibacter sp. UNC138MFCol5.1]|uniref:malic enzyme-like NAD(P)-binding protein n=1 Tax=Luteibacter sp. UNC138MFCol5.1 TaxID=1502774 RepID=UPI0008B5FB84|nr:malic enzyme-like NAD(P)-binding protein [Luteibacter sp. UNC138MFCol5.1]SEO77460.1 Malic enzyme, NAD binding domain [Luteibacter sp. UNC138MFCol5.1]
MSTSLTGYSLLRNPRLNRGTAFPLEERKALGIEGLLPPAPSSLEHQIARIRLELSRLDTDLLRDGVAFVPGQGNNVDIFPAMGMALYATQMRRVTQDMFIVAARASPSRVSDDGLANGLMAYKAEYR